MDWISIVTALGGLLSGGGGMAILNWRSNKRKAEAEVKQAEAEVGKTVAESMSMRSDNENRFIDQLQEQQDKYLSVIDNKDKKIDDLYERLRKAENKVILCASNLCVHHACGPRAPGKGLGEKWIAEHANETDLGGDYYSTEEIFTKYINDGDHK